MNIGSPIFEHMAPLSYTTCTHYILPINFAKLTMDFSRFKVFGRKKTYHWACLTAGGTLNCSTHFEHL
jgi:hypothetical protein